jgi:hypothetical protein
MAMMMPGIPIAMNVFRHPRFWLPQPPIAAPMDVPTGTASA